MFLMRFGTSGSLISDDFFLIVVSTRIGADFQNTGNISNARTIKRQLDYQGFDIRQISLVGITSEKLCAAFFAPIPLFFCRVVPFFLMFSDEQLGQVITSYLSYLFISASLLKHDLFFFYNQVSEKACSQPAANLPTKHFIFYAVQFC